MSEATANASPGDFTSSAKDPWWRKEDWWAVLLGLGLVGLVYGMSTLGAGAWLAVAPKKWSTLAQLTADLGSSWPRYLAQYVLWLVVVALALQCLGRPARRTVPAFTFIYLASGVIFILGQWSEAVKFNLEPPLLALALGLLLSNLNLLPRTLDDGFRVEFYIKLGVVLLGATLPFTLILWAGPIALLQASAVSIMTFVVIYAVARAMKLDPRFAATLGVGGAVCGVSAAIAIAAAVGARKQQTAAVISIVILWAIVMIFVLPFASSALHLPAGVGGAWIGTSEFADGAGFAASQAYGGIAAKAPWATPGAQDQAVAAFTLMKVVGRDVWIGIWAIVLSIVATSWWESNGVENRPSALEIWRRFPKFVLGFLAASLFITVVAQGLGHGAFSKTADPNLVAPIKSLRTWAFAFGFLSIGLTTRLRDLSGVIGKPLAAFSVGVAVNVLIGLLLSAYVFAAYWSHLGR